jgi:SAM-dependent methyltransferase
MPTIRSVLSLPIVYRAFWNLLGGPKYFGIFVDEYVRPEAGARILDIGCGPGTTPQYLPKVEYVGFDSSPEYIESARRRFPQGTFVCDKVSEYTLSQRSYFDVVLAVGIIHHLDDVEARQLFHIAHQALKPGGRLVTLDGVLTTNQSPVARYLVSQDRGEFVRDQEGYVRIARQSFSDVRPAIRQDLSRVPYTHIIMECIR